MQTEIVVKVFGGQQELFRLTVGGQLCGVHDHRSAHRRHHASPESEEAFLSGYSGQRVHDALVVSAFGRRQATVGGHTNQRDLRRRTGDRADRTGEHANTGLRSEVRRSAITSVGLQNGIVDAHTDGGVGRLSQETRTETRVHSGDALVLDHGPDHMEAGLVLFRSAADAWGEFEGTEVLVMINGDTLLSL